MGNNKETEQIYQMLAERQLRSAIDAVESFGYKYPELRIGPSVERLRNDYDLMAGYWRNGFKDASLDTIYNDLIAATYRTTANASLAYDIAHNSYLTAVYRRTRANGRDNGMLSALQEPLENFVSDMAMLEFEPEGSREGRRRTLLENHQTLLTDIFDFIWTSEQWSDGVAESVSALLTAPTVDPTDQQVIVSAIMLATMNVFDVNKQCVLFNVYRQTTDENVRQRALVGFVFSLANAKPSIFPDTKSMVDELTNDEANCEQLTEMQIQLLYCLSAEQDTKTVQQEIMPEIIKQNNFHVTSKGIEEIEYDPMEDILDSEASERRVEKMEEGLRKMVEMQKNGADIYFGGFAQMKRFPFFDDAVNWFMPFNIDHPAIVRLYTNDADRRMVGNMMAHISLCDSDRYSFSITFQRMVDKLPSSLREVLSRTSDNAAIHNITDGDENAPAYVRRNYLHSLYRFFRLFHSRSCFVNPFAPYNPNGLNAPDYVFFANPLFRGTPLQKMFSQVVSAMAKRKLFTDALDVLSNYGSDGWDYQYYMLAGSLILRHPDLAPTHGFALIRAAECYEQALRLKPADTKALVGYAHALFEEEDYENAAETYKTLMELQPDNKRFTLSYCVCLVNIGQYDEAQKLLFMLNYEQPDDDNVKRILARTLVGNMKYEQAMKLYATLTTEAEDLANRAYCEWFMGDVKKAVDDFAEYIMQRYPDDDTETKRRHCKGDVADSERDFIAAHGISDTEVQLMVDSIRDAIVR